MYRRLAKFFVPAVGFALILAGGVSPQTALAGTRQEGATGDRSTADGVYTVAQAERGLAEYRTHCEGCHGADLLGDGRVRPAIIGERFLNIWREHELDFLFEMIRTRMPPGAASGDSEPLGESTYVDILTYVLQRNDLPDGPEELEASQIASIRLVGKDGPQPLPNLALMQVVGCLTADGGDEWTLTQASDPVRLRAAYAETTAAELDAAARQPLGSRVFRLQNLEYAEPPFAPDDHRGHKVSTKGVLIRQFSGEFINALKVDSVGESCPE